MGNKYPDKFADPDVTHLVFMTWGPGVSKIPSNDSFIESPLS